MLGGAFGTKSGTSMATPNVAGVAGLVKAQNPGYTPAQVANAIMNSVNLTGRLTTDPVRRETSRGVVVEFRVAVAGPLVTGWALDLVGPSGFWGLGHKYSPSDKKSC